MLMPALVTDEVNLQQTAERRVVDLAGLGLEPLVALGRYRYLQAHAPQPSQRHRSLVVLAVPVRSTFDFVIDGAAHTLRPGQAVRVPPGRAYSTGTAAEPRGALIWLIARIGAHPATERLGRAVDVLAALDGPLTADVPEDVQDHLHHVLTLLESPRDWIDEATASHSLAIAVLASARAFTEAGSTAGQAQHHRFDRLNAVLEWIEKHLSEPLSPTELAGIAGLSTTQFYEEFRTATGTSPKDYLLRRKTEVAREWLRRDTAVTITNVAHSLGFSSSQRFATVFRRYQGMSPTECRENFGGSEGTPRDAARS